MIKGRYFASILIILILLVFTGCATMSKKVEEKAVPKETEKSVVTKQAEETKKKQEATPSLKEVFLLKSEIVYFPDGSVDSVKEFSYDNRGKLIEEIRKTFEGKLLGKVKYNYSDNLLFKKTIFNDEGKVVTYYVSEYKNGNLLSVTQYDSKDNIQVISKYAYDKLGNKILWEVFDRKGIKMAFTKYYYDNRKVIKKEIYGPDSNLESYITISYSDGKKMKEEYFDSQGKIKKYIEYQYSNNLLQNEIYYNFAGEIVRKISFNYDTNKNINGIEIKNGDGKLIERIEKKYVVFKIK